MTDLTQIASNFEEKLGKQAARGKKNKSSRKQLVRKIDKATTAYKSERKKLDSLQKEKDKLEQKLSECQEKVRNSRSEMLKLKKVLRNMDLADSNYAILYEKSDDCGYIVDGEEYHLDVGDDGELEFTPMKDHKKQKREEEKQDSEKEEDSNSVDDLEVPNFRLLED